MLSFNHTADSIVDSFNITKKEQEYIDDLFKTLVNVKKRSSPLWFIQRVWIDEVLSDNAKAFLIFTVGRYYEFLKATGDYEE